MENLTKCPVCNTEDFATFISVRGSEYVYELCNCGAAFLNPRMTEEELFEFYSSGEYRKKTESTDERSLSYEKDANQRKDLIIKLLAEEPIISHLDIGCSSGVLLKAVAEVRPGIKSLGVDPDPVLVTKEFDVVKTLKEVDGEFDLITMLQTLEHIPNPRETMKLIQERLSENGMLVIEVPNRRANMVAYIAPQHVVAYDETSLLRLIDDFFPVRTFYHGDPTCPLDLHILQLATK